MIVEIPAEDQGKCDIYLDDGVTVVPDLGNNLQRASAAFPLAMARHFMSRLRFLMHRCKNRRRTKIKPAEAEDLRLMQAFLTKAHQGISMNLLTFRRPNIVLRLDASTSHGLGGYSADGRLWRWAIPIPWLGLLNINILEFLAVVIGIWIEVLEGRLTPLSCILAMTDNTSAAGWVRKSNFSELRD
eukprot:scaffold34037_cov42-Attheya_sp.AAC.3